MRNARTWRIKIDAVLAGERFDLRVLRQILRRSILDVMIDGKDWLRWICDASRPDLLELWDYRAGVVVCHHVTRTNGDEIATVNHRAGRESIRMTRRNLLNQRQTHISSDFPTNHTNYAKR